MGKMMKHPPSGSMTTRILRSLSIFGSIEVISLLCSVIRTKLVAVWLGAAGVGIISLYNATLDMLRSIMMLSTRQSSVREIASASPDDRPAVCYITNKLGIYIGVISAIITAALSPLLSRFTFGSTDYAWGFAFLSLTMFATSMMETRRGILQGLDMLKPLATSALYGAVVSTVIAIPLLYYFRLDAIVPVLATYYLITMAFTLLVKVPLPKIAPPQAEQRRMIKKVIQLGSYLTVATATTYVASYILRVYFNSIESLEMVGCYQAGFTILNSYVGIVFTAISMEYYPRLSALVKHKFRTRTIMAHEVSIATWILMPIVVIFICADELIVRILYAPNFLEILPYISVAIIGTIMRGVSWCQAYVIIAKGDGKTYVVVEFISVFTMLALSIIGWHLWGYAGLGVAYIVQFVVYTLATDYVCRRRYGLAMPRTVVWQIAMALLVCSAALALKIFVAWWAAAVLILPWLIPLSVKRLLK